MIPFTLIEDEDGQTLSALVNGTVFVADDTHPYFDAILQGVRSGDSGVAELFDLAKAAGEKFTALTDRVSVKGGTLYLDGDPVHDALAGQVVRFIEEGVEDWKPLVAFFENTQANPNEHSREQLFNWLAREEFSITADGLIVGYKGVRKTDAGYESIHSGRAVVNGEEKSGRIPNGIGDVIEMPRSQVQFDPSIGCHTGLHVGNFDYANGFAQGALLEVTVNPRDVVSVPSDCSAQKMRVCRYTVVGLIEQKYEQPLRVYDQEVEDVWGDGEWDEDEDYLGF